ncbi:MAG TPA: alpha/beta hydrolase-fold protein [Povalibacter sp.]|uniref:alpha/beta hydrolase n=1 Tax=Povalibacter sp. TaxID=1962978 RepID=UPI002B70FE19|nr:alpha/beta hydrolase-fold protein [Povalibacter sp.]HMN44216.1 alpha/beta hydrolase-fold protein [Povalibacter sp.]
MNRTLSASLLSLCLLFVFALPLARADDGKVLESREFKSTLLGRNVSYSVYLPAGYESSPTRRYPVVYLLHGMPFAPVDSETDWIQQGSADRLVDAAIASGRLPPMILVMPDARTTWYQNSADGKVRYESMLIEEFIPFIDRTFRTRQQRLFRSAVGLSMGGYGAMMLAMRHPELFSAAAALSPGIRTEEEMIATPDADYERFFAPIYGAGLQGEARLNESWRTHSPLALAKTLPVAQLRNTRWWIDIGDDDFLSQGSDALHTVFRQRQIPHEYRVRDGEHNWTYWRTGLVDALEFVAGSYR